MHLTKNGTTQIGGHDQNSSVAGLRFGTVASIDTTGNLDRSALYTNQGSWLDTPGNLTGGLVFVNPSGAVEAHISTTGVVRMRGNFEKGLGPF